MVFMCYGALEIVCVIIIIITGQENRVPTWLSGVNVVHVHLHQVAGNTVRSHMAGYAP